MKQIAIHEAGHAVAHVRFGWEIGVLSIRPNENTMTAGVCTGPSIESVECVEDAEKQVLAYLAGYAALIASGHSEESAMLGADDDMEKVETLLEGWLLGNVEDWKARAIEMMSKPENANAVSVLAAELEVREYMNDELPENLIGYADGEFTQEEWQRYLLGRQMRGLE
jgi:hypothetical protein